jgi:hypothetical protein
LGRGDVHSLVVSPQFEGCGIVDTCVGDVLIGPVLYEVKAGDRPVRSIDIRQLLTYAALNFAKKHRPIDRIGLVNPRLGKFFEIDLDTLCEEVGGGDGPSELLERIIYKLSSGEISG